MSPGVQAVVGLLAQGKLEVGVVLILIPLKREEEKLEREERNGVVVGDVEI